MIHLRAFRNGDPPALVDLWNRATPGREVVRPLTAHELDALAFGKPTFDAAGLIVAERDGRVVGFAHAGFGPAAPEGPSQRLDTGLGTVAMLLVDPAIDDPALDVALFRAAEGYLRSKGAAVIYAGGLWPLNPFYWGLYGGSEFSGILDAHAGFRLAAARAGCRPCASTTLFEADLARDDPRDPRTLLLRRQYRLDADEDALPLGWWRALALGLFRPTSFRLLDKMTGRPSASAWGWEIPSGPGFADSRVRFALIDLLVDPPHRRLGLGRLLLTEVMRHARSRSADVLSVQTSSENTPARCLYRSMGFDEVGSATLYRLPAGSV